MVTSMNALYFTASIKDLWSTSLSIARLSNLAFFFFSILVIFLQDVVIEKEDRKIVIVMLRRSYLLYNS